MKRGQFGVLFNHGQGPPMHLFHPAVQIAQRALQILLHTTRPGQGSRSSVQAIGLSGVLLGEGGDVARDGAQLQGSSLGRMPGLERHTTSILSQHLSVSRVGLAAAQRGCETIHHLRIQNRHVDS